MMNSLLASVSTPHLRPIVSNLRTGWPGFLQQFDIPPILVPVSRAFVFDQEIAADNKNSDVGNTSLFPALPRLAESDSADSGEDIDTIGLPSKLNDVIDVQEVVSLDAGLTKPEGFNDFHQSVGVILFPRATKISMSPV